MRRDSLADLDIKRAVNLVRWFDILIAY